ncbi:MAG: MFS transporter, partial [Acidimicrobiia bacterium]|nr:MFS transporter [Acidimicrobiia bacterium]
MAVPVRPARLPGRAEPDDRPGLAGPGADRLERRARGRVPRLRDPHAGGHALGRGGGRPALQAGRAHRGAGGADDQRVVDRRRRRLRVHRVLDLLGASAVQAVGFAFMGPARMAFTGELVGRAVLPNAIVLAQMSLNSTRVLGPSLAGVLIGVPWFGTAGVYFFTAGLSLVALGFTSVLPPGRPSADRPARSPGAELLDGLRYVRANPTILLLVLTSFFVVMLAYPYMAFLPSLADATFDVGPGGYGVLSAVSAVGAL